MLKFFLSKHCNFQQLAKVTKKRNAKEQSQIQQSEKRD